MPNNGLQDIIPLLLQIDEGKRQERQVAAQEMQAQTQQKLEQAGAFRDFATSLDGVRDPNQLNAMTDFFSTNYGIDRNALANFASQYLPTLAAQRAGAAYTGASQMTPDQRAVYNNTAAYSNITGMGQADAAQQQAEAGLFSDPAMFNSRVQMGSLFRRTGYQPGKQEIALNVANDPSKVESAAAIEAGTGTSVQNEKQFAQNLLQMQLQRDIATQGNQVQIRGQNLTARGNDLQYAVGIAPYLAAKQGGAGAHAGFSNEGDALKFTLDAIQEQNKGGSDLHNQILNNMINKVGSQVNLFARDKQGNPIFPSGTYAPSLWDKITRR